MKENFSTRFLPVTGPDGGGGEDDAGDFGGADPPGVLEGGEVREAEGLRGEVAEGDGSEEDDGVSQ